MAGIDRGQYSNPLLVVLRGEIEFRPRPFYWLACRYQPFPNFALAGVQRSRLQEANVVRERGDEGPGSKQRTRRRALPDCA